MRDVWIRTQSTAVASWRATDLATHPLDLATHPLRQNVNLKVKTLPRDVSELRGVVRPLRQGAAGDAGLRESGPDVS